MSLANRRRARTLRAASWDQGGETGEWARDSRSSLYKEGEKVMKVSTENLEFAGTLELDGM